jgi:hypothetical protein
MTAKDHNKIIGILFLIQGALGLFGILIAILMFGAMGVAVVGSARNGEGATAGAAIFGLMIGISVAIAIFLLPAFAAGYGMLKEKRWAKIWATIAACLVLLSFPFGTALGVYALWFLFGDQGKSFYNSNAGMTGYNPAPPPNSWQ